MCCEPKTNYENNSAIGPLVEIHIAMKNHSSDTPSEDEALSRMLRDASHGYLMDDGFTARVTAALPSGQSVTPRRTLLIGSGAFLGIVIAVIAGGPELLLAQINALYQWASEWTLPLWAPAYLRFSVILSTLLSGTIAWFAWSKATRRSHH